MAYMKVCPECEGKANSASKHGRRTCPYCDRDITDVEVQKPNK